MLRLMTISSTMICLSLAASRRSAKSIEGPLGMSSKGGGLPEEECVHEGEDHGLSCFGDVAVGPK